MSITRTVRSVFLLLIGLSFALTLLTTGMPPSLAQNTGTCTTNSQFILVSRDSNGTAGNQSSGGPSVSIDGRYTAFTSNASNLVPDDTNNVPDVFVYDRATCLVKRVSLASDGTQANARSGLPTISATGRYVAFQSDATNLVANDTNQFTDTFVHDMFTGQTVRVSVSSSGAEGKSLVVVGEPDTQPGDDMYATPNPPNSRPAITPDGRYVAFTSGLLNLVDKNSVSCKSWSESYTKDSCAQVYLHDMTTGQTILISVDSNGAPGAQGPSGGAVISNDGNIIAFNSHATNLRNPAMPICYDYGVPERACGGLYVWQRDSGVTYIALSDQGYNGARLLERADNTPTMSADGHYIAFGTRYQPGTEDEHTTFCGVTEPRIGACNYVYRYDRLAGVFENVVPAQQIGPHDEFGLPSLSADGRYLVFEGGITTSNFDTEFPVYNYKVFFRDMQASSIIHISDIPGGSSMQNGNYNAGGRTNGSYALSGDASTLAFDTINALTPGDPNANGGAGTNWDVYLRSLMNISNQTPVVPTNTPAPTMTQVVPTNTPVPTIAATRTPTKIPTAQPSTLKVQYMAGNIGAQTNQIKPYIKIINLTSTSVPLSELKVRYWYTRETAQPQIIYCDYAAFGCANLTKRYVPLTIPRTNANFFIEYGFTAEAGSLAANGGTTGAILTRLINKDWSIYTQTNDYSFDATKTSYADYTRITLYRNGVLIWGTEPMR